MNTEEHDKLWHLLGKARQPSVPPFFARNVLREVRTAGQTKPGLFAWLRFKWVATGLGAAAAILITMNSSHFSRATDPDAVLLGQQVSSKSDVEVINHLDELIASEENSVWLENSSQ